ncbi:MAG: hypothetical protein GY756_08445, partial [bacterium]|nr:hypothetical protein [bacterium]
TTKDDLQIIDHLRKDKKYIGTYFGWNTLSYNEKGFPNFSENIMSGPTDYKDAFCISDNDNSKENAYKIPSFVKFYEYAENNERIRKYYIFPNSNELTEIFKVHLSLVVEKILDRYVHIYNSTTFEIDKFDKIYSQIENGIYSEWLSIDICVPILFLKFEFDKYELDDKTKIEKMDDLFQVARAPSRYEHTVHPIVISSATHAFVLEGWSVRNDNYWTMTTTFSTISTELSDIINNFYSSLRIATGCNTGYGQIIYRAKEWADDFKANLPPIHKTSIRAYPLWFENYYWKQEAPTISGDNVKFVNEIFTKININDKNRLSIATHRLNLCFLRDNEEDSVIDATIALEVLLSDGSHQEMTHKLSLRVAALSKLTNSMQEKPNEVFENVKKIYAYRSAIVHGNRGDA